MNTLIVDNKEVIDDLKEKKLLNKQKINIMLITNRDSDNVGDQVIETCDIHLIKTILKNLGLKNDDFQIISRAAGIISKEYLKSKNKKELKEIEDKIKEADIIIFGGAPLFNFEYQTFYKRTIITLEIAQKYNIPVIFSSIGLEKYNENNPKCLKLKQALHFPIVKLITTRDDINSLIKYQDDSNLKEKKNSEVFEIAHVADPAVFSDIIFSKFIHKNNNTNKDTIGLAVVRDSIFIDNEIDFSLEKQLEFWNNMRDKLISKGYKVQFFSTGHFTDEILLDKLRKKYNIPKSEFVFNINNPEKLIKTISSYKAIVAYRLHANIVAYSLRVPAIGLTWNQKVPLFYESIHYPNRAYSVEDWNAETIVNALEKAINEGVIYDEVYAMALYDSLYDVLKKLLSKNKNIKKYDYEMLKQEINVFNGTSISEQYQKNKRKATRIYKNYHKIENDSNYKLIGLIYKFNKKKYKGGN